MTESATNRRGYDPSALLTPANVVTIARLLVAPVAFLMMLNDPNQSSWPLVGVWFALSASDFLDGTLARKYGPTRSGAFLDPLADKVLAIGGVACMWHVGRFPLIALVLIVVREIIISTFRSVYARQGLAVPASELAKWKTFVQLGAVGWVTLPPTRDIEWLADLWLWAGVVIGLVSGVQYLLAGSGATTTGGSAKT